MNEYDEQAEAFCKKYGFKIKATQKADRCPPWEDGKCIHGDRYRVTIRRISVVPGLPRSISFDYWNSLQDVQDGKHPSDYDVLACVGPSAHCPTDPDEVHEELGGVLKPFQAITVAKFATRLQAFFLDEELRDLAEIC